MKKNTFLAFCAFMILSGSLSAQGYKTAAGLQVDLGDGGTMVGPSIKHFFNDNSAVSGEVLFGNGITYLQAFYHYQKEISSISGLGWYIGGGPSLGLGGGGSAFYLRPMSGLDYKLGGVPLSVTFDWRPFIYLGSGAGSSRFTGARFGLGCKYVLK